MSIRTQRFVRLNVRMEGPVSNPMFVSVRQATKGPPVTLVSNILYNWDFHLNRRKSHIQWNTRWQQRARGIHLYIKIHSSIIRYFLKVHLFIWFKTDLYKFKFIILSVFSATMFYCICVNPFKEDLSSKFCKSLILALSYLMIQSFGFNIYQK